MHKEIKPLELEADNFINAIVQKCLPTAITVKELQQAMRNEPQMQALSQPIVNGYIAKQGQQALAPYKHILKEFTTSDDVILRGNTILIPSSLHSKAVCLAYEGHQGLLKTSSMSGSVSSFQALTQKVNHCSRRVPNLSSSNQHKTTGAI